MIEAAPRARADLWLRATATAADLLRASSGGRRRRCSNLWLLWPAVRVLPWPPIQRATRVLAFSSSLAITHTQSAEHVTQRPRCVRGNGWD